MAVITGQLLLDLDEDAVFGTDLTARIDTERDLTIQGVGRQGELDAAGQSSLSVDLGNEDGELSPLNAASSLYPKLHPYKQAKLILTHNAVNYPMFLGIINEIGVDPSREAIVRLAVVDLMFLLSTVDVTLPQMADRRTGEIINRLLDYAEIEELCANPRFKDDLTGYSAVGGASAPTRETDIDATHAGAAMDIAVSNAAADGWRFVATAETSQGQKVTDAIYVWAHVEASVGKTVVARVVDDTGVKATGIAITLTGYPRRAEVTGTYDGASTARYIEAVTDSAQGVFTFRTGAVHGTPAGAAIARAVDPGDNRLKYVSYRSVKALDAVQEVRDEELGGLFYFDGEGKAVYEDQYHRWRADHLTSQATFTDTDFFSVSYVEQARNRIREIVLYFPRWEIGDAGRPQFQLLPAGRPIVDGGTLVIDIDYAGGLVRDTITPVATTDYIANADPNGNGADETANVTLAFEDFGGGAQATFTGPAGRDVYLTFFQVRGTAVRGSTDRSPVRITNTAGPVLASPLQKDYRLQASVAAVTGWGRYLINTYGAQREGLLVSLSAPWPAATAGAYAEILGRKVSDRITVQNTALPWATDVNGDYYIDSIDWRISGHQYVVTWALSKLDVRFWLVGDNVGDDVMGP